jgi:hypothetical protein
MTKSLIRSHTWCTRQCRYPARTGSLSPEGGVSISLASLVVLSSRFPRSLTRAAALINRSPLVQGLCRAASDGTGGEQGCWSLGCVSCAWVEMTTLPFNASFGGGRAVSGVSVGSLESRMMMGT